MSVPPGSAAQVAVTSELAQTFRIGSAFSAGQDMVVAQDAQGQLQVLSLGSSGQVISFSVPAPGGTVRDVAQGPIDALPAIKCLAVARGNTLVADNRVRPNTASTVVACTKDNRILLFQMVHKMSATAARELPFIPMNAPTDACAVHEIKVGQGANGQTFLVALCHVVQAGVPTPALRFFMFDNGQWRAFSGEVQQVQDWQPQAIQRQGVPDANGVFVSGTLADGRTGVFAWAQNTPLSAYSPFVAGDYSALACAQPGPSGSTVPGVFAISRADAGICWIGQEPWRADATTVLLKFVPVPDSASSLQGGVQPSPLAFAACTSGPGNTLQMYVLRADHRVYSLNGLPGQEPWKESMWRNGSFETPTTRLLPVFGSGYDTQLLRIDPLHQLHRVRYDNNGGWKFDDFSQAGSGSGGVDELAAYQLQAAFFTADDTPAPNTPVQVYANQSLMLEINGHLRVLDANVPWQGHSGADGRLHIALPTEALGAPILSLWAPFMPAADRLLIHAAGSVQTQLAALTPQHVLDATMVDASGANPVKVVQGDNNVAHAGQVVQAVQLIMAGSLAHWPAPSANAPPVLHRLNDGNLTSYQVAGSAKRFPRSDPSTTSPWQLDFTSGAPVFRSLPPPVKRAAAPSAPAIGLGDLLNDLGSGLATLENITVGLLAEGWAEVRYTVGRVAYYLHHPIQGVEDAFHLARAAWHSIGVEAVHLYRWLGWIFNWADIRRSREAIEYLLEQTRQLCLNLTATAETRARANIAGLRTRFDTQFDAFMANVLGANATTSGLRQRAGAPSADLEKAMHRSVALNPFHRGLQHHQAGTAVSGGGNWQGLGTPLDATLDNLRIQIEGMGTQLAAHPSFANGVGLFNDLLTAVKDAAQAPMQWLLSHLFAAVKALVDFAFSMADELVHVAFEALKKLMDLMQTLFTTPLQIPYVSALFARVAGAPLSVLNMVTITLAVPVTALYKISTHIGSGQAPFPSDDSLTLAKAQFNYHTSLRGLGLEPALPAPAQHNRSLEGFKLFCDWVNTFGGVLYVLIDPVLDSFPPEEVLVPVPVKVLEGPYVGMLSMAAIVHSWVSLSVTTPWLDGKGTPPGPGSADGVAGIAWIYGGLSGPIVDTVLAAASAYAGGAAAARGARNRSDIGVGYTFAQGTVALGLHAWWCVEDAGQHPASVVEGIFANLTVMAKLLRLTRFGADPRVLLLLVGIDLVGDFIAVTSLAVATAMEPTEHVENPPG